KPINNRLDFLNYSLSLMRSIHEHGDQEPLIDVLSYKHFAYLLDAFIYYFRENGLNEINKSLIIYRKENYNENNENLITSNDSFFHRSSSTLCLSSLGPDPFQITIDDSLPLACRPQLLQPICRKEDLFGRFLNDQIAAKYSHLPSQLSLSNRQYSIPNFLQPNYSNLFNQTPTREDIQDKTNTKTRDDDLLDSFYIRNLNMTSMTMKSFYDRIYSIDNQVLERIYKNILPRIYHQINELFVEQYSMERVLHTINYPQLYSLTLMDFSEEVLFNYLTSNRILRKLLIEQITYLKIDVKDEPTEPSPETLSIMFALILSLCKRLIKLSFCQLDN
ncbi:unnamed protein product, partial [Rotaria sordida]